MTRTDAILKALRTELERQRPALDFANDLSSVMVIVKLRGAAGMPHSVIFQAQAERSIPVPSGD